MSAPPFIGRLAYCVIVAAGLFSYHPAADAEVDQVGHLRVSPDGHYLTEPDGSPFFWLADTAWDLFQRLDREEVDHYFKDRAGKGFTVIQAAIGGGGGHQGQNRYGETPFIDGDPTRSNERYFAHVDWVIDRARHHGLRMAVFPYWAAAFQFQYGAPGEAPRPIPVTFNPRNAETYARWLGQRYRNAGISWVFGGDANPLWPRFIGIRMDASGNGTFVPEQSDMSAQDWRPVYDAMAMGLSEGEGRRPFITYHPSCCTFPGMPKPLTSVLFADRPWLTMNMIQSSHYANPPQEVHGDLIGFSFGWRGPMNYEPIAHEFAATPVRPVIDGEPLYEDLGKDNDARNVTRKGYWTGYDARNAAYHAVFAGAAGHAYGNHAIWQFADPKSNKVDPPILPGLNWREALQRPVSGQLRHLKALMLSRPYFTRVPDQSLIVGDAGHGAAHIGATRDAQGRYALIYLPHGQQVTVNPSRLAGRTIAWWFDPRTGEATRLNGVVPQTRATTFIPPSNGNEEDWVLVLDEASKDFGAPGGKPCNSPFCLPQAATGPAAPGQSPQPSAPPNVIFDTDMWGDIDDALAFAMVHALQDRGELKLIAVTLTTEDPWIGPYVDLVDTFYGHPGIPVGTVRGAVTSESLMRLVAEKYPSIRYQKINYTQRLAQRRRPDGSPVYPRQFADGAKIPDAVPLLRKTLAAQPDGSVVMIQVGASTNFARLLESPADAVSRLDGAALVKQKVRLLSVMAGSFARARKGEADLPKGARESNLMMDVPSAQKLFDRWPTPLVASGLEIGVAMRFPATSIERDFSYVEDHPIAETYRYFSIAGTQWTWPHDHATFDLTSVLYATRPDRNYFALSKPGKITVLSDGGSRFVESGEGTHRYLILEDDQKARTLEAMVMLASQPPAHRPP